ncbi:MAG: glucose-6-phosphate dehydrogenase assembly protein OpcA [Chloroflexota bacterium]
MDAPILNAPAVVGQPVLRWSSHTDSLDGIEAELARIWNSTQLTTEGELGHPERRISARTSVLNLVVIARQPELGERASAVIRMLAGRHPSRTLIVSSADPDGPSWMDAHVRAHCILPRETAPETCAEFIDLVAGGEAGQHVAAIVAPLLVHDLPVTLWWPGDPPLVSRQALDLLEMADRLVVDGSTWSGDGVARLRALAALVDNHDLGGGHLAVSDFAMLRQTRWREAIASCFDLPDLRPFVHGITRIAVTYAAHDDAGDGGTNIIKPLYHVGWLASRLDMSVTNALTTENVGRDSGGPGLGSVLVGSLRSGRRHVAVRLEPVASQTPPGTTLTVELTAERRGGTLEVVISAEAEAVIVRSRMDGRSMPERRFMAPRRAEVELLAEIIESAGQDPVAIASLRAAARLVGHG